MLSGWKGEGDGMLAGRGCEEGCYLGGGMVVVEKGVGWGTGGVGR